jgi:hypothetical protein
VGDLEVNNKSLSEENISLRAKLTAAEVKLTTIECEIESARQKSLQKTVELLEVPTGVDALAFLKTYSTEIGCAVEESDINNIYSRTQKTRNNSTKTKIVLEFTT